MRVPATTSLQEESGPKARITLTLALNGQSFWTWINPFCFSVITLMHSGARSPLLLKLTPLVTSRIDSTSPYLPTTMMKSLA